MGFLKYLNITGFLCTLLLLPGLCLFTGCGSNKQQPSTTEQILVQDALGRKLAVKRPVNKVMGLSPAMTEMLYAVCSDSQIVAVTQNCNFPEQVKLKPVVNTYPLDLEGVIMQDPELVFTEEGITPTDQAERLSQLGVPVYYMKYRTVDDVLEAMLRIGELTGNLARAQTLVDSLKKEQKAMEQQTQHLDKPSVLVITWTNPIYVYGRNTVMSDKLQIAGARNAVEEEFDKPYPELTREYILKMNPDVIIGGSFEQMDSTFFSIYPELKKIDAYRNKRIFATNGDLTARPSPRIMESVKELFHLIHGTGTAALP